jgi:hypothetical protein
MTNESPLLELELKPPGKIDDQIAELSIISIAEDAVVIVPVIL